MSLEIANSINFYECDQRIIALIKKLSERFTVIVTSGKRSPESNKACGGAESSRHLIGDAVDIRIKDLHISKWGYFLFSIDPNIGGIGIDVYRNIMHVDYGPKRIWTYDREGRAI